MRRGHYAVAGLTPGAPEIPEFFIATQIVKPSAISHWSAMSHHGFTEQIPRTVTAITTKRVRNPAKPPLRAASGMNKQHWEIGHVDYEFIYVLPAAFFGIEEIWLGEFFKVPITDKERTILEGFIWPSYFGGLAVVLAILQRHLAEIKLSTLTAYARKYDTATVIKRLGWALERLATPPSELKPLLEFPVKGYSALDPSLPMRGSHNRRWMIVDNLSARKTGDERVAIPDNTLTNTLTSR